MAELILDCVSKRFGDIKAVAELTLAIADGEFVVLLGPTGAGKTTTLRLVAGLERPDGGSISIAGRDVTAAAPAARDVTFVFQQYSLYPHFSVYDNLAFPLRSPVRRLPEDEIKLKVEEVASLLGIASKLDNRATRLSGGEMQRVAIGRALVRRPAAALMDEPLSSLDAKLRAELRLELQRIQQDFGTTILYVTHDQIEAMTMATHIGVIEQGRLIQLASPREIYEQPASLYVAQRLGSPSINVVPRNLLPVVHVPERAATIGARTEHIRLLPPERAIEGAIARVDWVEHLGDQNHLHLAINGYSLVTLADGDSRWSAGDAVGVELVAPLFFDADGRRIGAAA